MKKFNNQYRISSARLPHWDYSADGAYFITICTHNRTHFFGKCQEGQMILSTIGAIVQGFWYEIPKHFPFVELGAFVVMPNHIHGILVLLPVETLHCNVSTSDNVPTSDVETLQCNVPTTTNDTETDTKKGDGKSEFYQKISPKSGSVSTIIRSYKSVCTKHIHQAFPDLNFEWQTRFWDNIVQSETSFNNITQYIINNPQNWDKDRFFDVP
jgi:putative transposase